MNKYVNLLLCLFPVWAWGQQPSDAANPDWRKEIPRVVFPDKALVELYVG